MVQLWVQIPSFVEAHELQYFSLNNYNVSILYTEDILTIFITY